MAHYKDPYTTTARFNSTCKGCGKEIKKGASILYDPYRKLVYGLDCCESANEILRGLQAEKSFDQFGTDIY